MNLLLYTTYSPTCGCDLVFHHRGTYDSDKTCRGEEHDPRHFWSGFSCLLAHVALAVIGGFLLEMDGLEVTTSSGLAEYLTLLTHHQLLLLPSQPFSRLLLGAVMMAFFGFASRRGSTLAVTAFSLSARTAATATSATSKSLSVFSHRPATAFRPRLPSTSLRQSTTTTAAAAADSILSKLEQSLEVTHPAYEVIQKDVVTEYGAYCTLYRHKKSGAELLSVAVDDDNKVFGITFRTPPEDSTGVPHILEHSVLCGSRKYKTKDPFVQLLQGSLVSDLRR